MNNLTDLCIQLSEKLGWEADRAFLTDHAEIYEFIAHAKAELAKRGWHPYLKLACGQIAYHHTTLAIGVCDYCHEERTAPYPFEPTNPLSTAGAELKAMAEALS